MLHNVSAAAVTSMGREGYILSISNHSTLLTANDARGIFYGVQTLKQLLNKTSRVTAQLIEDKPDTVVRGAFLMTHTFEACNVTWLKKAADLMSSLKMNTAIVTAGYFAAVDGLKTNCGDARLQLQEAHHYFGERYIDVVPTLTAGDTSPEQIAALQCGPDIAEGMWVRNETFVVHEDGLHPALPFETGLPTNGNMTEPGKNGLPAGWESSAGVHLCDVDNTSSPFEGGRSLHCTESSSTVGGYAHSNKLSSCPGGLFELEFWVKSAHVDKVFTPVIELVIESPSRAQVAVGAFSGERTAWSGEWQRRSIVVATPVGSSTSEPSRNVTLYVITRAPFVKPGAAPGKAEWWLTGLRIRRLSAGLRNLIRTNASDIEVRLEDGSPMTLGKDYRVRDPERPSDPFFPDWSRLIPHQILPLPGGRLHRGDQVKVSYDFLPALPGEAMNALAEPRYYQALEHYTDGVMALFSPKAVFFVHDEMRGIGRDSRSIRSGLSNAGLLARSMNKLQGFVKARNANASAWFWDDMINPYHNGARETYQVPWGGRNGSTAGALNMTDPEIGWLSWWYSSRDFDGKMGNTTHVFGSRPWFGCPASNGQNMAEWGKIMASAPGARGMIDTNWDTSLQIDQWGNFSVSADYSWNLLHRGRQ